MQIDAETGCGRGALAAILRSRLRRVARIMARRESTLGGTGNTGVGEGKALTQQQRGSKKGCQIALR